MTDATAFLLKLVVTVLVAAALSVVIRAAPMSALAQSSQKVGGEHGASGFAVTEADRKRIAADRDLAERMIDHYRQAIEIAKAELEPGENPRLRTLAEEIIADQERQIARMQEWLSRQDL